MQHLNAKQYQVFNNEERLHLTLAAIARDDIDETLLLRQSCPKRQYIGADLDYQRRLQALYVIHTQFNQYLTHYRHKLELTGAAAVGFSFLCESPELIAEYQTKSDSECPFDTFKQLFNAMPEYKSTLKSICIGLVDFCDEIDIDYKDLLALDKFHQKPIDISQYLSSDAPTDEKMLQQMKNSFLKIWQSYVFG